MKHEPSTLQCLCLETIQQCLSIFNIPDHWWNGAFSMLSNEQAQALLCQSMNLKCLNLFSDCVATDVDLSVFKELSRTESAINNIIKSGIHEIFPNLQKLGLSHSAVTDYGLAHLSSSRYQDITNLDLSESLCFTVDGLSCLAELQKLVCLNIDNCKIALEFWPLDQHFETLLIGGNTISSSAMVQISNSSSDTLETFSLWGLSTSGGGYEENYDHSLYLLCFEKLKKLDLRWVFPLPMFNLLSNEYDDLSKDIAFVPPFINLQELDLSYTNADDNTLKNLKDFKLLFLSLNSTKITRKSIRNISNMYSLQSLDLSNTNLEGEKIGEILNFFDLINLHSLKLSGCVLEQRLYLTNEENMVISLFPFSLRVLIMNNCTFPSADMSSHVCVSIQVLSNLKVLEISHAKFDKQQWKVVLTNKSRYICTLCIYMMYIWIQKYDIYMDTYIDYMIIYTFIAFIQIEYFECVPLYFWHSSRN